MMASAGFSASSIEDAAKGCIFGALLGDATGAIFEFQSHDDITEEKFEMALQLPGGGPHKLGPCQFTDDGEMTVSSMLALNSHKPDEPFTTIAHAQWYKRWLQSKCFSLGTTTRVGLIPLLEDDPPCAHKSFRQVAARSAHSESNGALMRCSPLAIFGHKLLQDANANQRDFAKLVSFDVHFTHSNELVHATVISYTLAIASMLQEDALGDRDRALNTVREWLHQHETGNRVVRTGNGNLELAEFFHQYIETCPPDDTDLADGSTFGCAIDSASSTDDRIPSWSMYAYTLAFRHLLRGKQWLDAMRDTIRLGGDTDTNACVVGALLGCAYGLSSLDSDMVTKLRSIEPHRFNANSDGPLRGHARPEYYQGKLLDGYVETLISRAPEAITFGLAEQNLIPTFFEHLATLHQ